MPRTERGRVQPTPFPHRDYRGRARRTAATIIGITTICAIIPGHPTSIGPAVEKKGNYRIPIGTPLRFVLETVGGDVDSVNRVFLGGPMMGQAVSSLEISITKGTSGVVAFTDEQAERTHRQVHPCIRCGACFDVCKFKAVGRE